MTTQEIYQLAVELGVKHDLRGQERVQKYLQRLRAKYEELPSKRRQEFDAEKLTNPYSDSRVLVDNNKKQIKKILVGIDAGASEVVAAKILGDIDLLISHHPQGVALADLHDVMQLQAQVLADYGVPINIAESVIKPRIAEVSRGLAPLNHSRVGDLAKLFDLDFMCTHTTADNLAASFVVDLIKQNESGLETVGEVLELLKTIPEYREAVKLKAGPRLFTGHRDNSCGRIAVTEFTGGTSGAKEMYEKIAQAGIGTIIGMHMGEEHRKQAEKYHLNILIAGHMASDSLGMNLFLDQVEARGMEIVPVSGLIRVKRLNS